MGKRKKDDEDRKEENRKETGKKQEVNRKEKGSKKERKETGMEQWRQYKKKVENPEKQQIKNNILMQLGIQFVKCAEATECPRLGRCIIITAISHEDEKSGV